MSRIVGLFMVQILILSLFTLFTSCRYSDNISLNIEYNIGVTNFSDSSKTAYIATQSAYRRAEGLAAFPDGGQPKVLYRKKGIYIYDAKKDELIYLKDLTKPANSPWHVRLRSRLVFKENLLYYDCTLDTLKSIDSLEFIEIKKVFVECISIDINTKRISPIETTKFNELYNKYRTPATNGMFRRAKAHPLEEWGLVLKEIYPKSDDTYIDYFVSRENGGNSLTRKAIIEQIIANKTKDEIREILNRMDEYKNSLEGHEKLSYEIFMEDAYESIRKLL